MSDTNLPEESINNFALNLVTNAKNIIVHAPLYQQLMQVDTKILEAFWLEELPDTIKLPFKKGVIKIDRLGPASVSIQTIYLDNKDSNLKKWWIVLLTSISVDISKKLLPSQIIFSAFEPGWGRKPFIFKNSIQAVKAVEKALFELKTILNQN